jgi:hypothetical protein
MLRISLAANEVLGLHDCEVAMMFEALRAIRLEGDLVSPVENFICGILDEFRCDKLTPDVALDRVRIFTEEFNQMRDASQAFIAKYVL